MNRLRALRRRLRFALRRPVSLRELSRELGWPEPDAELLARVGADRVVALRAELREARRTLAIIHDRTTDSWARAVADEALRARR